MVVAIAFFARITLLIIGKTNIFPENWPGAYETGNIAAAIAATGTFSSPFGPFDAHDSGGSQSMNLAKLSGVRPTTVALQFRLRAEVG